MPASRPKSRRTYLDHNATSPLAKGVADAVAAALQLVGNPSSLHAEGRAAQSLMDVSRNAVAEALGASAADLVFTSGGTEANHLGFVGLARAADSGHIALPPTVHPSLWAAGQRESSTGTGGRVLTLPATTAGRLDLAALEQILGTSKPTLLGVSLANHELGCIEDMEAVSEICRGVGCLLFCDAVQGVGRLPIKNLVSQVDGLSISAHKIGGPKGVGAVWLRPGLVVEAPIGGGKQESGRRPGTQPLPLIAGFAAACSGLPARLADAPRQAELSAQLQAGVLALGARLHSTKDGLCNTTCLRFPGVAGELLVAALDLAGFAISTGAACSSGTTEASAVLLGIGLDQTEAREALRLSLGMETTADNIDALLEVLPSILERAKRFR